MPRSLRTLAAALALAAAGGCSAREPEALLAYVAVAGNNHVQVVDLATGGTLRKIYAGAAPWRLVLAPDGGSLWVQHWSSGTTAVVDLRSHEVKRVLPLRGPGVFSADGARFLSFHWPGSALDTVDARTFEHEEERVTEAPQVYDAALGRDGESLYLVQFDPMARGPRERFGYALSYALKEGAVPVSHRTGRSPAAVRVVKGNPFILTADRETNGLTLLNSLGDGRAVPTCPAPRAVLLSPDETRMVVPCWRDGGARRSQVYTYRTDFSTRPWPTVVQEGEATVDGAVVAGAFSPSGDRVYLVDRAGNRLLEADPATLELLREIPTGDLPVDVAVLPVDRRSRDAAAREGEARKALRTILAKARTAGKPFSGLAWTEEDGTRRLRSRLAPPDRYRIETPDGAVRLAAGGWTVAIDPAGRFRTAPRQELVSLVYNLPNLTVDEAVRQLAGDVPGSPWLRGGIAVDVVTEIEEGGTRYVVVGAAAKGERTSQLWLDAGSGRPAALVEQFPVFQARGHGGQDFGGAVETRFQGTAEGTGGAWLPAVLERSAEGGVPRRVRIVEAGPASPPAASFDLARLGGAAPPRGDLPPTSGPRQAWLADWGAHREPVPHEQQVHNLEHGGVILQYNCPGGCPDVVERLEALARERDFVLVAPYPWMKSRIALTAWGRIEILDSLDEARIHAFLDAWAGRSHEETAAPETLAAH
ncbi:MAG TPA: DUF3105 domain-containing protein [Thermoanaerobaculia bacterium]